MHIRSDQDPVSSEIKARLVTIAMPERSLAERPTYGQVRALVELSA